MNTTFDYTPPIAPTSRPQAPATPQAQPPPASSHPPTDPPAAPPTSAPAPPSDVTPPPPSGESVSRTPRPSYNPEDPASLYNRFPPVSLLPPAPPTPSTPNVILRLPLTTMECARAEVVLDLAEGSPPLDPKTMFVEVLGSRPDVAYWYYDYRYRINRYWEWNEAVCREDCSMFQCRMNHTEPPPAFKHALPITTNTDGNAVVAFFPDVSGLDYRFSVVGAKIVEAWRGTQTIPASDPVLHVETTDWKASSCRLWWQCVPVLNHFAPPNQFMPPAYAFALHSVPNGPRVACGATGASTAADVPITLWIHPFESTLGYESYKQALTTVLWTGHMESDMHIYPVNISSWDPGKKGWAVDILARDPGEYTLRISLGWYFGKQMQYADPPPRLHGDHVAHRWLPCALGRAYLFGCTYKITITAPATPISPPITSGERRCTRADVPGRWVKVAPLPHCALPYCTGDRNNTKVWYSISGDRTPWVYVPFDCHYRLFTPDDIEECTRQTNVGWLHVMGDSTVREMPVTIFDLFGGDVSGRFESDDRLLGWRHKLRVSFRFPGFIYHQLYGEPRDWDNGDLPLFDAFNLTCPTGATACPDVFLFSPTINYVAWKQDMASYREWIPKVGAYFKRALAAPPGPRRAKLRILYFCPYWLWGQAHSGSSPYITQERLRAIHDVTLPVMMDAGVEIFNATEVTRSRPGSSWDGTHYLRMAHEAHGATSNMMGNMLLNTIFRDCSLP